MGIDTAMETGRIAADVLHNAITEAGPSALQQYPRRLDDAYAEHHKVGRVFARVVARPAAMHQVSQAMLRSRTLAESMLRISSGALRHAHVGPAELIDRAARTLVRLAPEA